MSNEKHSSLKPTTLRLLLILAMFGITSLAVAGFIFSQQKLSAYAIEVSHKKVDAAASKASLQTLKSVEKQLTADQETIEKAKNIKHFSNLPQFKAIDDLKKHAGVNKIGLSDISFAASNQAAAAPTGGATGAAAATPLTTPATDAEGVDISFKINDGQVRPIDLVTFLYDIEHSTPKMQIKGISIKKGTSDDLVTVETITVRMFTTKSQ